MAETTQPQILELSIRSSFLDRKRKITITSEYLEFDNNDRISDKPTRFLNSDISALRYGINWIRGYAFVIGRIYQVDIKSKNQEIIKLRLKSLYGINKERLTQKYYDIVNALYNNFFDNISRQYLDNFANSTEFELLGIIFKSDGIYFMDKKFLIEWLDIGTASYTTYYAIFSKSNKAIYRTFEFLTDWNVGILYSVSRQILKEKGLDSE